jgi:long-chain acyl-CoA synthetase
VDKVLHHHAERQPSKAAVLTTERGITYGELDTSVTCLARHLLDRGLQPGDRVALHWSNSIETVQLLLAAFRAGLVAVPINLRLTAPEIAYIFQHASTRICFSEPALAAVAEEARSGGSLEIVTQLPAVDQTQAIARRRPRTTRRHAVHLRNYRSPEVRHPYPSQSF